MSRQRRRARTRIRRPRRQPKEPKFIRVLALSVGYCGICGTSFNAGEPIYWCRKTDDTQSFRCHEMCYLTRMHTLGPSWKPSPTESELAAMRTSQET